MRRRIDGDLCHALLLEKNKPELGFSAENNFLEWKSKCREKLIELLGIDKIIANSCDPELLIEEVQTTDKYKKLRFSFYSEAGALVPCYLLIPNTGKEKYPVAICLQGHTGGFHHSIGELKNPGDEQFQPHTAHAFQAVDRGFCALAIEQRAMGERYSRIYEPKGALPHPCSTNALTAINFGRTTIGERAYDVSRSIDMLSLIGEECLDLDRIIILGHSGGGTASFYSACYDERISYTASCGAFCSFKKSIMSIAHCVCNYIPNICNYFEMGDLSCLIAPRRLSVMTGQYDPIFPIDGVNDAFRVTKNIYEALSCPDNARLVVSQTGHVFDEKLFWSAIIEDVNNMGWKL
jgi:hypothetical protein